MLDSPEIGALIAELEATRWTGRPGYPIRAMVGMALAKSIYAIPTWRRTARLVAEHPGLQAALGCCPSVYACYRFAAKLREHKPLLDACLDRVTAALHAEHPEMGPDVAIDGSDLPAYANGQRFLSKNGPERERLQRPRRLVGPPLRRLHSQGWWLLRLQGPRGRLRRTDLPLAWTRRDGERRRDRPSRCR